MTLHKSRRLLMARLLAKGCLLRRRVLVPGLLLRWVLKGEDDLLSKPDDLDKGSMVVGAKALGLLLPAAPVLVSWVVLVELGLEVVLALAAGKIAEALQAAPVGAASEEVQERALSMLGTLALLEEE